MSHSNKKYFYTLIVLSGLMLWGLIFFLSNEANAEVLYKVGSFAKKTSTGAQTIGGVGFQPKALIFLNTLQTAVGNLSGSVSYGVGFAASSTGGVTGGAVSLFSLASSVADTSTLASTTREIVILSAVATVGGAADVTSFDADGFTLNWLTANATAYLINYIAIGGADITNATSSLISLTASTGNQSITNTGFRPDFLMFIGNSTSTTAINPFGTFNIGIAASSTQGSIEQAGLGLFATDVLTASDTCSRQSTTSSIVIAGPAGGTCPITDAFGSVTSFDTGGFTINKSDAPSVARNLFYLALKGGDHQVGSFTKPVAAGFSTTTGIGHDPEALFFITGAKVAGGGAATVDANLGIGATNLTNQGVTITYSDSDADGSPDPDVSTFATSTATSTRMFTQVTTGAAALRGEARLSATSSNSFSLLWSTADATARELLYWSVAPKKVLTASATGTQVSPLNVGQTNQYVGGAFMLSTNTSSTNVTSIKITETNTVNANSTLSNLQLLYETDATKTCTFDGTETSYGTSTTFNASEQATVTGSMTVGTSTVCVYPRVDVGSGASGFLDLEITNPSSDIIISAGTSTPATAVAINGSSTLSSVVATVSCSTNITSTSFATLTASSITTSTPNASTTMTCSNTTSGCSLTVYDVGGTGANAKGGLWNSTSSVLIRSPNVSFSATSTLATSTAGYGIRATTTSAGSGGTLSIATRYNTGLANGLLGSVNDVGGLSTSTVTLTIASSTSNITGREIVVTHKAAISNETIEGTYDDMITYSCFAN